MAGIEPAPLSESVMSGWATQLPSLALYLVPSPGLEPGRRYQREILSLLCLPFHQEGNIGVPCRIRTHDLVLRRHLLYPAELRRQTVLDYSYCNFLMSRYSSDVFILLIVICDIFLPSTKFILLPPRIVHVFIKYNNSAFYQLCF